jgi:hypothetical protein
MKYILRNSAYIIFKKNLKYILLYYIIITFYLFTCFLIDGNIKAETIIYVLGLNHEINETILDTIIFIFNIGIHFLILLFIINNNEMQNNILTRMSYTKYTLSKISSLIIIQFLIYMPFLILISINLNIIKYILYSYILYLLLEIIYFYITTLKNTYRNILTIILIILIIIGLIPIKFYLIQNHIILISLSLIVLLILLYILSSKNVINIKELEE